MSKVLPCSPVYFLLSPHCWESEPRENRQGPGRRCHPRSVPGAEDTVGGAAADRRQECSERLLSTMHLVGPAHPTSWMSTLRFSRSGVEDPGND